MKDPDVNSCNITLNFRSEQSSSSPNPNFYRVTFSVKEFEIMRATKSLKRTKSQGEDNNLSEFLVVGRDCLIRRSCKLFNLIFQSHNCPKQWILNLLKPIHKMNL